MDFQSFVNIFAMPCAVLSVQKISSRRYGEIRIVCSNDMYKSVMGVARCHDDMLYSDLIPKDVKFEDFCYRSAVLKKKLHCYVNMKNLGQWVDQTLIPIQIEEDDLCYCAFFFEFTRKAEPERMAQVNMDTASFVIKNCITLRGSKDFIASMTSVMSDLQQKAGAFCAAVILLDHDNRSYEVLCEKFDNKYSRVADFSQLLTYDIAATWERTIGRSNGIIIKDEHDMESVAQRNPQWTYSLKNADIESVILYPLTHEKQVFGYMFLTNFDTEKTPELKELVELTAFFLSAEITNYTLMEKLKHLRNIDILTGVKNRNAMNQRVDLFVRGEEEIPFPYGVIFVYVIGLKQANDENGHDTGDAMLKKAARLLKEFFWNDEIYRSGGDEFVIIVPACQEEELSGRVRRLKEKSGGDSETCLAVGYHWNEEGKKLRRSMQMANKAMLADKERFLKERGKEQC